MQFINNTKESFGFKFANDIRLILTTENIEYVTKEVRNPKQILLNNTDYANELSECNIKQSSSFVSIKLDGPDHYDKIGGMVGELITNETKDPNINGIDKNNKIVIEYIGCLTIPYKPVSITF